MISRRLMLRVIRRLYAWSRNDPVDEELRGWNWDKPPLKPRAYLELGVSEVASLYCETRRDIWLKRAMGVKPEPSDSMVKGKYVHEAITRAIREVARLAHQGLDPWNIYEVARNKWREINVNGNRELQQLVEKIYKYTLVSLIGEVAYDDIVHGSRTPLVAVSELKVDGSNLGLSSSLSIDVVTEGGVIVDFKYGAIKDFHKLSITGYALALESEYEVPHDYGLIVYVYTHNEHLKIWVKPVYINSHLRKWFIAERDAIIDMLIEKKEPPRDSNCSSACPYYKVCTP
ncbi:MAG: type I-A CRISPR-associated protein Cas4/Csa1 [Desulfurococcaceae archaeon]